MEFPWISFILLTLVITGGILVLFRIFMFSSTDGALKRLDEEINKANRKQMELSEKIRLANDELEKRKQEARQLADKMRSDAEEASKSEREKIVANARKEGEEILVKAQNAREKIKEELEKEFEVRVIQRSMDILNQILSAKGKGALNQTLIEEYVEKLKEVDMSRIGHDVKEVQVTTLSPLPEQTRARIAQILKEKLNRDIALKPSVDEKIGGGVILKFGTMALDGSMQNMIREIGIKRQQEVEMR